MPTPLVPRIITAFRATYPTITEGLQDDPAVRAVLKYLVTQILSQYEATLPAVEAREQIQEIESQIVSAQEAARLKALTDAGTIVENPQNN